MPEAEFPEWVLLDTMGRIGPCDHNVTTAAGMTSAGWSIEVAFDIAEPPALSRFFVHFPDLASVDSRVTASVTGADAAALLIRLDFPDPECEFMVDGDVFIYWVAPSGTPSLYLLPTPYPTGLHGSHVAILSCDDDVHGNYCLVVVPERQFDADGKMYYDLRTFSTKTESWSTKVAYLSPEANFYGRFYPTEVLSIGEGLMAWVDLRYGIMLCNLLDEQPEMRMIELGSLMGSNKVNIPLSSDGMMPPLDLVRDITFTDGRFRFMEIEYPQWGHPGRWRATIFTRTIEAHGWEHFRTFDSSNFSPGHNCDPLQFPMVWDHKVKEKPNLNRKVIASTPTQDMYRDDVVYMMTTLTSDDQNGWVLGAP